MKQIMILLKKDLIELFKTNKALILGAIFIIFSVGSPILAKFTPDILKSLGDEVQIVLPEPTTIDSYLQFHSNIVSMSLFALIIIFGNIIANEKTKGIYTDLVNNGVTKFNYIFAKIKSQAGIITLIYIISVALFGICNYILFEEFLIKYAIYSFISMYVYLIFVTVLVNFFSVIAKSNIMAIVLSFVSVFLLMFFELFKFGKCLPNHLAEISTKILSDSKYLDHFYQNIFVTLALIILLIAGAIKFCKNKE